MVRSDFGKHDSARSAAGEKEYSICMHTTLAMLCNGRYIPWHLQMDLIGALRFPAAQYNPAPLNWIHAHSVPDITAPSRIRSNDVANKRS